MEELNMEFESILHYYSYKYFKHTWGHSWKHPHMFTVEPTPSLGLFYCGTLSVSLLLSLYICVCIIYINLFL